jgi:ABC-type cobalamin transport system permease subunit
LHTARDQLIQAAGVIAGTTVDLAGNIGRQVLGNLMPGRRLRTSTRTVKRAISKYNARGPGTDRTSYKAALTIDIFTRPALATSPDP